MEAEVVEKKQAAAAATTATATTATATTATKEEGKANSGALLPPRLGLSQDAHLCLSGAEPRLRGCAGRADVPEARFVVFVLGPAEDRRRRCCCFRRQRRFRTRRGRGAPGREEGREGGVRAGAGRGAACAGGARRGRFACGGAALRRGEEVFFFVFVISKHTQEHAAPSFYCCSFCCSLFLSFAILSTWKMKSEKRGKGKKEKKITSTLS